MLSMSSTSLPIPKNLSFSSSKTPPFSFNLFTNLPFRAILSRPHRFSRKSHLSHNRGNRYFSTFPLHASSPEDIQPSSENHLSIPQKEKKEEEEEEARQAVLEILREFGVSNEDSFEIALNSPRYLRMLIDSVRDLDEFSLWSSWRSENDDLDRPRTFKKKVYYMAKEKGDNGKVAFLESIGLNLSSAMNVARYLVKESLPSLIYKVKHMKEMFFSNSDNEEIVSKKARRMMMHLSIPIDEDIQQTLSFFEKIEARRGGLDILCSRDLSFQYVVESFPRLLLLSTESSTKPLVDFLENIGVPRGCMRNLLLLFPPIFFFDIEKEIKPRILAFQKIGAVEQDFGKMLLKYPWIISTSIQDNYEEIVSFFELEKVPKVSADHAIKSWPLLLGCSTSKLRLMIEQFGELSVRNKKLGQVIATSPQLLLQKPLEFLKVVSFFEDLGFDRETIGQILGRCPELFATSMEKILRKKLEFLSSIGISRDHLPRVIKKYPELLVSDVEKALLPRMKYLRKTGLSRRDIAFMVRRFSPILGYSIDGVLRPKLEFLLNTMERPVKDVVDYPRYFSYSLEKKIKPRFWVLKGRKLECSLKEMLAKNDEEFAAEFMGIGRMLVPPPTSH